MKFKIIMKKFLKSKNQLIIFVIAFVIIAAATGFFIFKFNKNINIVRAGFGDNLFGFAWNSNIGWISFNSTDCDIDGDGTYEGAGEDGGPAPAGCPAAGAVNDYGVSINPTTGNFSGYAWSNNIGWISFEESDLADYNFNSNCDTATCVIGNDCTACYNSTDNYIYGWAKILSMGNDGWIKLGDPAVGDTTFPIPFPIPLPLIFGSFAYSVSIDSATDDFHGWAWNANNDGSGIGWISFNCEDEGVCAVDGGYDYKVSLASLEQPVITPPIDPVTDFQCSTLKVDWGAAAGATGYRVFRDTVQVSPDFDDTVFSFTDVGLSEGVSYDYIVQAFNLSDSSDSASVIGTTLSVCEISSVEGIGECPNIINLSWAEETSADHYEIDRCNENLLDCSDLGNYSNPFVGGDDCDEPSANQCADDTINLAESDDYFRYIVRAIVDTPLEEGDWSDFSDEIQPCPNMPTWKEVK